MKFAFGMVVSADFLPETRLMVLCPATATLAGRDNWWVIVLRDATPAAGEPPNHYWQPGEMVTLSPDNAGLRIVDTPEGSE